MRKIKKEELNKILDKHKKWLDGENGGEQADLSYTNLKFMDLGTSCLTKANLQGADLRWVDLSEADLSEADLRWANLSGANLSEANLQGADLSEANLSEADLSRKEKIRLGYINNKKQIVYKKCGDKIVKLQLLCGSIVFSINNYKCRTNKVKVLQIGDKKEKIKEIASNYDSNFIYKVGKIIEVKDFNLQYNIECGAGIHFFFNKKNAKNYNY